MPSLPLETDGQRAARALLGSIASVDAPTSRDRDAYLRSAAVLVSVKDPEVLYPLGISTETSALDALGSDLRKSSARAFKGEYILETSARREALRRMTTKEIRAALELNVWERTGNAQRLYEQLLSGKIPNPNDLEREDLEMAVQLMTWLQGVRPIDRQLEAASARLEYQRYLAPFDALASDRTFVGRRSELDDLRTHVGVLPPHSVTRRLRLALTPAWMTEDRPALSVYGPGGVGKSTLISRFVLEHLSAPQNRRIALAYLDFDRPDRDIADVVGLAAEIIRQIRAQRGGSSFDELLLHAETLSQLEGETEESSARQSDHANGTSVGIAGRAESGSDVLARIEGAATLLNQLLELLVHESVPGPVVVILDSFEEVQYRNESRAQAMWEVIGRLSNDALKVRTVICGRAPVRSLQWNNVPATELEIGELDDEAAVAFLRMRGFDDPNERNAIIRLVGRMPLSLVLAATLLRADGSKEPQVALEGLRGKRRLWFSAADEVIQGQLYERILGHIHDPRVRKLAHPGLVLRRVTPGLIQFVLNEPCGLGVATLEDAISLFDELKRETSLVSIDDAEDSVVHRRDLRTVMLRLIEAKEPDLVQQIHRRAAEWYIARSDLRSVAEGCYHMLHIGEFPERFLADSEIRASLQASINDFSPEVQESLFRVGFLREKGQDNKRVERWHDTLISTVEQALPYAAFALPSRVKEFYAAFDQEHSLRLALLGWRMFSEMGDVQEASRWMARADKLAPLEPDPRHRLDYLSDKCWHLQKQQESAALIDDGFLEGLGELANRLQAPWAIAQHGLLESIGPGHTAASRVAASNTLRRIDAFDLWNIFPVVGLSVAADVSASGAQWDVPVWLRLAETITDASGPLMRADLQSADLLRSNLISSARRYVSQAAHVGDPGGTPHQLKAAILEFCAAWPYHVLRVQPAYGSSGHNLAESAA